MGSENTSGGIIRCESVGSENNNKTNINNNNNNGDDDCCKSTYCSEICRERDVNDNGHRHICIGISLM